MGDSGWLFEEVRGEARVEQYVNTVLLRIKVRLFFRRWRRVRRVFLTGWMSRG